MYTASYLICTLISHSIYIPIDKTANSCETISNKTKRSVIVGKFIKQCTTCLAMSALDGIQKHRSSEDSGEALSDICCVILSLCLSFFSTTLQFKFKCVTDFEVFKSRYWEEKFNVGHYAFACRCKCCVHVHTKKLHFKVLRLTYNFKISSFFLIFVHFIDITT